ncbi:MAG: BTAD domain-containing putative transcriptional regulator [Chloroflexota bacterium]
MAELKLTFLGSFSVSVDEKPLTNFATDKVRALLAYVALEAGQAHNRSALAGLLWPDIAEKNARDNIRLTLHRLRQALDKASPNLSDHLLTITRQTVQFNEVNVADPNFTTNVDVTTFQTLIAASEAHNHHRLQDCDQCLAYLEEAAELNRGPLLKGFSIPDATLFEEWLFLRREMVEQQALTILQSLADVYEEGANFEKATTYANRLLQRDPYRESTHRQLMRLFTYRGIPDQALAQYAACHKVLKDELGVEPSTETQQLLSQIREGQLQSRTPDPEPIQIRSTETETEDSASNISPSINEYGQQATSQILDIPSVGSFFGRKAELSQLQQWLVEDQCRVVAILGIGGMGKTSLAAQCARILADHTPHNRFDLILWRSLLNAPPLSALLPSILQALSDQPLSDISENLDEQLRLLLKALRQKRVLLILDNMESILEQEKAGTYRPDYEVYGQLLQQIATYEHQGQLLLTSRERPRGYERLEGDGRLVQVLHLEGLDKNAGYSLLADRGLQSSDDAVMPLVERYSGNPLALELVADTVGEIFDGDIAEFLAEETLVFDDIRDVLDQQFARLSDLEQEILFWLAVEREAISASELRKSLLQKPSQRFFLEALRDLQRRSLIRRTDLGFELQNVIIEYLCDRLIEAICQEIETAEIVLLHRHALLRAQAKEHVRQSQERIILSPIGARLTAQFGLTALRQKFHDILNSLRDSISDASSYAPGNILNLLVHLDIDLMGFDFSQLTVWETYLRSAHLPDVNFTNANLRNTTLGDTFGEIHAVAFSPTGEMVAVGTLSGEISLWSAGDAQLIAVLKCETPAPIWSIAFSPDGSLIASGGIDRVLYVWDVHQAQLRTSFSGYEKIISSIAFSPDGTVVASGSDDRVVRLWDISTGQLIAALPDDDMHSLRGLVFSPDGRQIITGSTANDIVIWDLESGQIAQRLQGHSSWVLSISLSPDGKLLASGGRDQTIIIWDVKTGQIKQKLQGHEGWVESVAFSPDGRFVLSGSRDRTIRFWDVANGVLRYTLLGHASEVVGIAFSPDGKTLASGDEDRNLYLWDMTTRQVRHRLMGHTLSVRGLAFSPNGKSLASGNTDQTVRFWQLNQSDNCKDIFYDQQRPFIHSRPVIDIAFSPNGKILATGNRDHTIHLLDTDKHQIKQTWYGHADVVASVSFNPAGTRLASGSLDETVRVWDVKTGQCLHIIRAHQELVNAVDFSPDGTYLASGGGDEVIHVWHANSVDHYCTFAGHRGWVDALAFSADGKWLVSGGADSTVYIWDVESQKLLHTLTGHDEWIRAVAISDDRSTIASGSHDQTVRLWDISTLAKRGEVGDAPTNQTDVSHILSGHTPWVTNVDINSTSRIVASSSGHQTIRLWDIDSGQCIQTLKLPGLYEGLNITGITGISDAQKETMKALGAVEDLA